MLKKITALFIISILFYCDSTAYAWFQKQKPYTPPSEKQYKELRPLFVNFSSQDLEKSINISKSAENIDLINNILVFLQHKKLIRQTKKLPPIFLIYSQNNQVLSYKGGSYSDNKNIILLNANLLMANTQQRQNIPKNIQAAIDFVVFSSILSHELTHFEDFLEVKEVENMDSFILSEQKAYEKAEKTIDYFLKMTKAEADEIIPIPQFYDSMQIAEEYFINIRKNYIKMVQAADILLNNENKVCKTFGIDKNMFKMITFLPHVQFNAKYGGHIVRIESNLFNFQQTLKFDINTLTGIVSILNPPKEIEAIRKQAKNIQIIDKNSYLIIR